MATIKKVIADAKVESIEHPDHSDLYRVTLKDPDVSIDVHAKDKSAARQQAIDTLKASPALYGVEDDTKDEEGDGGKKESAPATK
jgi:hypothetical protein